MTPVPMNPGRVALNLMLPRSWQDIAVDWLLDHASLCEEFSVHHTMAHAQASQSVQPRELVQGHVDCVWVQIIATRAQLPALQAGLLAVLGRADGRWWTQAIEDFGRLNQEGA